MGEYKMKIKRKLFANITNSLNQTIIQLKPTIERAVKSSTGIKGKRIASTLKSSADNVKNVTGDSINSFLNSNKTEGNKIISYQRPRRNLRNREIQTSIDFGISPQIPLKPRVKQEIHANGRGSVLDKIRARNNYNRLKDRSIRTSLGHNTNTIRKVVKTSGEARIFQDPLVIPGFWY